MLKSRNKLIAVTMGDPCGVGPEVLAAALLRFRSLKGANFLVIGNEGVIARYWPKKVPMPSIVHLAEHKACEHKPGRPTLESGLDSLLYLECAVKLLKAGYVDGVVTAPVSKENIIPFMPGFKGHTTFLANSFALKNVEMLFVADNLRVVLVTRHVPLKDVPSLVTADKIVAVVKTTASFVRTRFGIKYPRVALCGLNPHAGEGGHIGLEEKIQIVPAIKKLCKGGWDVAGPFAADTLFEQRNSKGYDLIVSMYHDQALTALKAQYFDSLVNVTVGLPFIRTSPAHGTAFAIAGKKIADPGSMTSAVKLAMELA